MSQTTILTDLIDRDDAELATWAIEWLGLDLAALWPDLDDDGRDWLVDAGIVSEVEADVECTAAESWESDWRSESNAAWPTYTLNVTADGMESVEVEGWHLVGPMGPDGNRQHEEWDTEDGDGACGGLPYVDGWTITSGDNVGSDTLIPCWRHEGCWVTLDREALGTDRHGRGSLGDAAGDADHGSEPTWEDVPRDDMERESTVHIIRDGRIVEVDLLSGGLAPCEPESDDDDHYSRYYRSRRTAYYATAWSHGETEDTYRDERAAKDAIAELADDGELHKDEDAARKALGRLVLDAQTVPGDLVEGVDDDGLYVEAQDAGERYHPDADQLATILRAGWMPVIDDITEALGVRETLAAAREWQAEMDAIIEADDPWVMIDDSVRGGNCPVGTQSFVRELARHEDAVGEIGAARASLILSLRDDSYTRRACRLAAQRLLVEAE